MEILKIMNYKSFYVMLESDLILDQRISSTTKIVYAVICNYSNNHHGYCYLAYRQLMEILHISKKQFLRCTNDLCQYNYISKIKKGNRTYLMPIINKVIAKRKYQSVNKEFLDFDWLNENE